MPEPDTICGYGLADVRKTLREAIDRRDRRAAQRWTAELVATPGAVGSLWASYWMAWAATGSVSPTLPILLRQDWTTIAAKAQELQDWTAFRNDTEVRARSAELTTRLLEQSRQTPVVWPSKEITLYDVGNMKSASIPTAADGPVVLAVWQREDDALEYRMMAGRFLTFLESGDLRGALSAVAWTMMTPAQQGNQTPLKCASRGPATLPAKARSSPLWFWLELGRIYILNIKGLHRGWPTMHAAITDAFRTNYKRWTAVDRMRLLLAWILQLRALLTPHPESLWSVAPVYQTPDEIDLPYKEVVAELADPNSVLFKAGKSKEIAVSQKSKSEIKMAEADAAIATAMGLTEDDI
jgi:anti-sigma factor RsiW